MGPLPLRLPWDDNQTHFVVNEDDPNGPERTIESPGQMSRTDQQISLRNL
jgi:hypothetical protein